MVSISQILPVAYGVIVAAVGVLMLRKGAEGRETGPGGVRVTETTAGAAGDEDGRVAVDGTARAVEAGTVEAPVAETTGVVVETTTLEQYASGGSGGWSRSGVADRYVEGESVVEAVPFAVEDETGRVRVDPGEEVAVELEARSTAAVRDAAGAPGDRADVGATAAAGDAGRVRVAEAVVEPGDHVFVRGEVDAADGEAAIGAGAGPVFVADRSADALAEDHGVDERTLLAIGASVVVVGVLIAVVPFVAN
jgi:hypothetical protein